MFFGFARNFDARVLSDRAGRFHTVETRVYIVHDRATLSVDMGFHEGIAPWAP